MGLPRDFEQAVLSSPKRICGVKRVLQELDDEDAATLREVLAMEEASNVTIARHLTAAGYPITRKVLFLHRRGECACKA